MKSALAVPLNWPSTTTGTTSEAIMTSLPFTGYEYGSVKKTRLVALGMSYQSLAPGVVGKMIGSTFTAPASPRVK